MPCYYPWRLTHMPFFSSTLCLMLLPLSVMRRGLGLKTNRSGSCIHSHDRGLPQAFFLLIPPVSHTPLLALQPCVLYIISPDFFCWQMLAVVLRSPLTLSLWTLHQSMAGCALQMSSLWFQHMQVCAILMCIWTEHTQTSKHTHTYSTRE